jgi:hypothetical protein
MVFITHKTTHTTGHVGWKIGSESVQEVKLVKFNRLNIYEVNPVAPRIGR